ncbi:Beta-lactamase-like protein [Colletotrichum tanaceti]|uniref:Beta-lactamase-like protein n=1 Tax=Colletotrichum tanaceti TaxID=1306861 RepID=A0A4V6DI13_9PEZI|nr:Beta-lactamase-like protein [Colletotrichum tanaceti]KAJ0168543.1 Beta-lactamase-like protein [Colletotrichum tanaceti]TKW58726.1 Beta-lactamase-like protein [Colletotrichum tanaceti]
MTSTLACLTIIFPILLFNNMYLFLLLLAFVCSAHESLNCRPEGPVIPRPHNLANSTTFQLALSSFGKELDQALSAKINAGWVVENTSFSLAVVSIDQGSPSSPLWEFHHLASNSVNGTKDVTGNSQYLIGSVSKVFSTLVLLKSGLGLDSPVTDYIPELNDPSSSIPWADVSLRALGSHLSGAPANYGFSEYYYLKEYFESLGFPTLNGSAFGPCGVIGLNEACTKAQLLEGMLHSYPTAAVMERPAYSNVAFTIFIMAVEQATGMSYSQLLHTLVARPLGLTNTLVSPGVTSRAVIPPMDNGWGSDYGINAPGGGLVSSLSDLSALAHGILSGKILSPAKTREWLKPHAFGGSLHSFVGLPWEIFRPSNLVPENPHPVAIYAKSGGAYGYRSQLAIIDEYGIAVVVLAAGDMAAVPHIYDAVLATTVPAVDVVAREQAGDLRGTFVNGPSHNCIHATIAQDNNSLVLSSLTRNRSDMLSALTEIWAVTVGSQLTPLESTFRIFPTEDISTSTVDGRNVTREAWRIWFEPQHSDSTGSDLPGGGVSFQDCMSWTLNDWVYYGSEPVDRFVFVRDGETEEVMGLEVPFIQSGLLGRVGNWDLDESTGCS